MDTRTGKIYTDVEMKEKFMEMDEAEKRYFVPLNPTPEQLSRKPPRVLYNEPCPCGSGKIFRKCCFSLTRKKEAR